MVTWSGHAWRFHNRRYDATSAGGSIKVTGRYHRGQDRFPVAQSWPALYLALAPHLALAERVRHTTPELLRLLNDQRLSLLSIGLHAVLDCCAAPSCIDLAIPELTRDDVCRPRDFQISHELALAARALNVEGMIVPSCSRLSGGNLVLFPDRLREGSAVRLLASEAPELYVEHVDEAPDTDGPQS